ncbi:lipid II:glycine glycyltransferase FemX [Olsenella urininfantis]|uniref:lipid II:glycine glycyltransferase FemX n=1 Tax=Olsenella urininfantis TaxID=1871033 RepID=UPI0009859481|nr:GNAT family N-acetyltransferase [Olsenella urininfantis]
MQLRQVTFKRFEEVALELGVTLPIEQTEAWSRLEETVEGRAPWGCCVIEGEDERVKALISFVDYKTHGYHYLRSHHGPVWVEEPGPEEERKAILAIQDFVRGRDKRQVFARLCVKSELPQTHQTLSSYPYDQTVVIDLTGGDEQILSRMKPRGRRDVRKSLRECQAVFADETERASASFDEYYEVMVETAERDDFVPAPCAEYENMLRILGPGRCRLFAGRIDGRLITWTIATISGSSAVRYYGASRGEAARALATDGLIYYECCELGRMGCVSYDQMGIGSDLTPELARLNTFKTKFAKEVTPVAPDRDIAFKELGYAALVRAKSLRGWLRSVTGRE